MQYCFFFSESCFLFHIISSSQCILLQVMDKSPLCTDGMFSFSCHYLFIYLYLSWLMLHLNYYENSVIHTGRHMPQHTVFTPLSSGLIVWVNLYGFGIWSVLIYALFIYRDSVCLFVCLFVGIVSHYLAQTSFYLVVFLHCFPSTCVTGKYRHTLCSYYLWLIGSWVALVSH